MLGSLAEGPSPPLLPWEESTLCGLILHRFLPLCSTCSYPWLLVFINKFELGSLATVF